jgi:hypothetical protein
MLLDSLPDLVLAVGALGTASYGLVDVSRAFGGGVSNYGFARIAAVVRKLYPTRPEPLSQSDVLDALRSSWFNGKPMADQIAQAHALIRLGLDPVGAPALAATTGLDPALLSALAGKLVQGVPLDDADRALLDRFDQIVGARLDGAYQHADQSYRNAAKAWAVVVSLTLALAGGWLLPHEGNYLGSTQFLQAVLAGLLAAPLAPVSKDLANAIGAFSRAVRPSPARPD